MTGRVNGILEAACSVIARSGVDRMRMSDVAREAGVSSALVHYYCSTRNELLARTFAWADEAADAQVLDELARIPRPLDRLEALLSFYLGDDELVHTNAVLWREMWSHARFDDDLRGRLVDSYAAWIDQITELLLQVRDDDPRCVLADADSAARRLAAIVDGLGAQLLLEMLDRSAAVGLVREAIAVELGARTLAAG